MNAALNDLLLAAQERRDAGDWDDAIRLFRQAEQMAPGIAAIKHNLALCHHAKGEMTAAQSLARAAVAIEPRLWQSQALIARGARVSGDIDAAAGAWQAILAEDAQNGTAIAGMADIELNELGDPEAAARRVEPLRRDPYFAADAELTSLMAELYIGRETADALSDRLKAFSASYLNLPRQPARPLRSGRRRIGLISPLFSLSPVYYLTWSTFSALAKSHDLIVFNRGARADRATEAFHDIAAEWHEVHGLDGSPLADRLASAELDILFDLGGWSDVIGLEALSAKPAARMYKWVGGQSATTGLSAFDGWIGDAWQCPPEAQPLHSEPLVAMPGGYVDYTPPPLLASLRNRPKNGVALVGNPAKIVQATMDVWPADVTRVTLIDRRYAREATLGRVTELLARTGVAVEQVIVPAGHDDYLRALASHQAIVNTQPYAAGLTAVEALQLGVALISGGADGRLFCSRHHLSHLQTRGSNPRLAADMLALVSAG